MSKRVLRLAAVVSLTALGIGSFGCWEWHRPIDERHERRDERREHHEHEEHEEHEHDYH
jgi:hypothetical protein